MTKKEFIKIINKAKKLLNYKIGCCIALGRSSNFSIDIIDSEEVDFIQLRDLFNYLMRFNDKNYYFPLTKKHIKTRRAMLDHFRDTIIELGWYKYMRKL